MATWTKMSTVPNPVFDANGDPASGYVLKCYLPGTTTVTSMDISTSGASNQATITANAEGKWEVSGNEVVPYIDRKCKWGIFQTAAHATANTPFYMGPFDNVEQTSSTGISGGSTATLAALKALTGQTDNEIVDTVGNTVDNSGGHSYYFDSGSSATDDSGTIIAPDVGSGRWLARFLERIPIELFGAVGNGDGAGGGTDDSTTLQLAFNFMIATDCAVQFNGKKIYRADSALSLELTGARQTARWELYGNGATLDISNQTGSTVGLTVGDSTQSYYNEKGYYTIKGLRILGPENATPINEVASITTNIGLLIVHAIRVHLEDVEVTRCYTGIKTAEVFPMTTVNCNVENNFIGLIHDDVSNEIAHYTLSAKQCWYSVLIFKSGTYAAQKIEDITFNHLWTEGAKVGVHIDPGTNASNRIREIKFNGGFFKSVTYDNWRIGQVFTFATPQTRGAKATGKIFNLSVNGGGFPGTAATATAAIFAFTSTSNCFGFYGHGSFDDTDANTIVNDPSWGDFLITGNEAAETISGFKRLTWKNEDQYRLPEVPHANTQVPVYIPAPDEPSPGPYAGTWTPAITFATAGDLSVAYSKQVGTYTKIGRMVFLSFNITTSTFTHTTASGALRISGMPHNPRTLTNYAPTGTISAGGITKASFTQLNASASTGSSIINVTACNPAASTLSGVTSSDCPTAGTMILNGLLSYETDA